MKDHMLTFKELKSKYNIPSLPKKSYITTDNSHLLKDYDRGSNVIFPRKDQTFYQMIYYTLIEPANILTISSVSILIIIYLFNKEEKQHLLVFLFTVAITIIKTTFEIFQENRINTVYKRSLDSYDCRIVQQDKIFHLEKELINIGDILDLKKGDKVGADAILIRSNNLTISRNIEKEHNKVRKKTHTRSSNIFEQSENVVLCGDDVIDGKAKALVVRIGKDTHIGKLYTKNIFNRRQHSMIYAEMNLFLLGSLVFSLALGIFLVLIGLSTGITFFNAIDIIISLVIGIIPEGIPSTVKLMLFSVVSKLESKGIYIRDVNSIEKLGLVTSILVEKDTLTSKDNIFCSYIYNGYSMIDVELAFIDKDQESLDFLGKIGYITGLMNSLKSKKYERSYNASLWILSDICSKYFVNYTRMSTKIKDVKLKNFDGTIVDEGDFKSLYVIGPVDSVLKVCNKLFINGGKQKLDRERKSKILNIDLKMKIEGYDSIAFAYRSFGKHEKHLKTKGLTFICVYFLQEMVEEDAMLAFNIFKSGGINFSVVTKTVSENRLNSSRNMLDIDEKIVKDDACVQINDPGINRIISSDEYKNMSNTEKCRFLKNNKFILYNCDSEDKYGVVKDLQDRNHIVCYIGSELDDSRALNQSNIGICFEDSNRICKEGSSMVLKSQHFEDIIYTLEEGRLLFINLQKSIKYIMMHVTPQVMPFVLYTIAGTPQSLSPILLLFLNYFVEVIPASFFSFENPEYNILTEKPINVNRITSDPSYYMNSNINRTSISNRLEILLSDFERIINAGFVYRFTILTWSIVEAGLIAFIGCILAFYSTLYYNGVPFLKMFYSANTYFIHDAPDLVLRDGSVIGSKEQLDILYSAQSTYFVGLLICQFSNILVCRREYRYFFSGFFENCKILIFSIAGIAVTISIIYVSFFENFLLVRRPSILFLLYPTGSAILILMLDTFRKYQKLQNKQEISV